MLKDILIAREQRSNRKKELSLIYNRPVVCITINIPFGEKVNPKYSWICKLAVEEYLMKISKICQEIAYIEEDFTADGPQFIIVAGDDPVKLKRIGIYVEEGHPLGRLFDIDVLDMSRENLLLSPRKCIMCSGNSVDCIVNRKHGYQEIFSVIDNMIKDRKIKICDIVVGVVIKSMLYEVSCTPKPGLVDMENNGAHTDMNYLTFLDGIVSLMPYFTNMVLEALDHFGTPADLFKKIRPIGIQAEKVMLESTGGINTHKGQIFSMGLICAATSQILLRYGRVKESQLFDMVKAMVSSLEKELKMLKKKKVRLSFNTNGERLYIRQGYKGARGEALSGFKVVTDIGIPALNEALFQGTDFNNAMVHCLICLMTEIDDTNILHRGGISAQKLVKAESQKVLRLGSVLDPKGIEAIYELDRMMIRKNISAGGSADMLAITIFTYFINDIII